MSGVQYKKGPYYADEGDFSTAGAADIAYANVLDRPIVLNLFSNFTYFLDDPVDGDQFEQADRRIITGGRIVNRRLGSWRGHSVEHAFGVQVRNDAIGTVGLYRTRARRRLSATREDGVTQTSGGVFAQTEVEWRGGLRTIAGLRADVYRFGVRADNPVNSGSVPAGLLSRKLSIVLGRLQPA